MSRIHASSNQHSAENGEGFPGKVTDSCKSWFFVIAFFFWGVQWVNGRSSCGVLYMVHVVTLYMTEGESNFWCWHGVEISIMPLNLVKGQEKRTWVA